MNIEQALKLALIAACPDVGARVTALKLAAGTAMPALTYQRLAPDNQVLAHDGGTALHNASFQVVIWSATYEDAKAVVAQVKTLDGYRGALPSTGTVPATALSCQYLMVQDDQDDTDTTINAQKVILRVKVMWKA
jgi:hypothetical protein